MLGDLDAQMGKDCVRDGHVGLQGLDTPEALEAGECWMWSRVIA